MTIVETARKWEDLIHKLNHTGQIPKAATSSGLIAFDFIGDFEVYKLIRDTFKKQGLSYRADYYRTAWDRNGGAKLTPQTTW